MSKDYEPLHLKYRPQSFDGLVGQESIALTLKQAITTNHIAPAYLFSGPRGTGKTSSARILAKSLNCIASDIATTKPCGNCELCKTINLGTALDVIEIDAASNTGVDNIRELIEKAQFAPVKARWKVYVIDECHMLSTAAFNALLKTLEEPPQKVVFILATTDPQRVLPTILSRCQRFDFRRIKLTALSKHLSLIATKEGIVIEDSAVEIIAQHAEGGLRDAASLLDQVSLLPQPIKKNSILELLGVIPENELLELVEALANQKPIATLNICQNLLEIGIEPISILQGFASILRDLIIIIAAPEQSELCRISKESHDKLKEISKNINLEDIYRWQSQLKGTENQLKQSLQPRLWLEILLLGLLDKTNLQTIEEIKIPNLSNNNQSKSNVINQINNPETAKSTNSNEISNTIKPETTKTNNGIEVTSNDLSETWQKILAALELPSTRMLLSQQANLKQLTEEDAIINVSSNWISMIQSRTMLIEEAINKTLGGKRKLIVNIEKELPKTSYDSKKNNQIEENTNSSKTNSLSQNNDNRNYQPLPKDNGSGKNNDYKNIQDDKKIETENINNKNLKSLADFFNGEIVDLNNN